MVNKLLIIGAILAVAILGVASAFYVLRPASGEGTLAMKVHDAPCANCSHVFVTFASVSVHASNTSGSGWTTLNVSGSTVDLEALNGSAFAKLIGVASLPAGHYEQVRLAVTNVTVVLGDGTSIVASIPASSSADVNGAFNITSGATTTISIDVDLASSLHVVTAGPIVSATFTPNIGSVVVA